MQQDTVHQRNMKLPVKRKEPEEIERKPKKNLPNDMSQSEKADCPSMRFTRLKTPVTMNLVSQQRLCRNLANQSVRIPSRHITVS